MPHFVCETCGTQHAESAEPPAGCAICEDERQYLPLGGQRWTTLDRLRETHRAVLTEEEPGLTGIGTTPDFAIGQRALLVQTAEGNLLWDCITYIDDSLVAAVRGLGGIRAIAISHPHYYSSMVEWAQTFECPVLIHDDDREWVMRSDDRMEFWHGEARDLFGGLTLLRLGGHFAGAQVLHRPDRRLLLTGDVIMVIPDRRFVSFMWSYPNLVPLDAAAIRRIRDKIEPLDFDRIYGAWFGRVIPEDAKGAVLRSADRYLRAIEN